MVELDGVPAETQPASCTWNSPPLLGYNGNGAPIYGPYQSCNLGFDRTTVPDLYRWREAQDGLSHTLRLPHPNHGYYVEFTGVYISSVNPRMVTRDDCQAAASGLDILVNRVVVD